MHISRTTVAAMIITSLGTVSACGGESAETEAAPAPEVSAGDCAKEDGTGVALDIPGPGTPTPEEAVAPYLDAYVIASVDENQRSATVTAKADGGAVRIFELTRRNDGWWPDGYVQCSTR